VYPSGAIAWSYAGDDPAALRMGNLFRCCVPSFHRKNLVRKGNAREIEANK
jgi:hypothetical protein